MPTKFADKNHLKRLVDTWYKVHLVCLEICMTLIIIFLDLYQEMLVRFWLYVC